MAVQERPTAARALTLEAIDHCRERRGLRQCHDGPERERSPVGVVAIRDARDGMAEYLDGRLGDVFVVVSRARFPEILEKISCRDAEAVKLRVERLIAAKEMGHAPDGETTRWVAELSRAPGDLAEKLARGGLIDTPARLQTMGLGPFLAAYIERRIDVKPATRVIWRHTVRNLTDFFGASRDLAKITVGDAEDFKLHLIAEGLAPTTVHKRLQVVRMFFADAAKRGLVASNPFSGVSAVAVAPAERQVFVSRETTERLMAACDPTWRLIVGLARYGGLRCPSEVLSLRWEGVNWEAGRIVVDSPKTEHHRKGQRVIPLFPELETLLVEAFERTETGVVYVVPGDHRLAAKGPEGWRNCNLRTQLLKIIRRAGLTPWPKLFQALRTSRETELAREHPIHVVTSWMGNTPKVALKHYLQVTDADFELARSHSVKCSALVAQNTAQHQHAPSCTEPQETQKAPVKPGLMPLGAAGCEAVQDNEVAGTGFEPATSRL